MPEELLKKYGLPSIESFRENMRSGESEHMYYEQFLKATDYVILKLIEGAISSADVAEELKYREIARQEIAKLEGEPYELKSGLALDAYIFALTGSANAVAAEQTRKALQLFAQTLDDSAAMEVATVFPAYEVGRTYEKDFIFSYGENSTGDPQLCKVVKEHTSQKDWMPDKEPSLYTAIGLTPSGHPIWNRPSGAHDAYNKNDIVSYNEKLYKSLIDGNTWSPDEYPAGWEEYTE